MDNGDQEDPPKSGSGHQDNADQHCKVKNEWRSEILRIRLWMKVIPLSLFIFSFMKDLK